MARNPKTKPKQSARRPARAATGRPRRGRPKFCLFCSEHATWVDYKDVRLLQRFVNDRGRIKSRGATGTCAQHQRDVAVAIKTARELALLPYAVRSVTTERPGGRGGGRQGRGEDRRTTDGESTAAANGDTDGGQDEENGADSDVLPNLDGALGQSDAAGAGTDVADSIPST